MELYSTPTGIIRREDLLNSLLAAWRIHISRFGVCNENSFSKGFAAGFECGLDAVAQSAGLENEFEEVKAVLENSVQVRLGANIIESELRIPLQE